MCDVNGTLALDGALIDGVNDLLSQLKDRLIIHFVSADTYGQLEHLVQSLPVITRRLQAGNEAQQKADYVNRLGPDQVAAIGQGANDYLMLKEAKLGIAVLSREGTSVQTLQQADLVVPDILSALELFEKPLRIVATLRQ